jgi:hypothetical protein
VGTRTQETPLGINVLVGAVGLVVCCAVPSSLTGPEIDARLGVLAVGLAAIAAAIVDLAAVAVSVGVGFLLFDGFVEGHRGDLVWNGRADVVRVGVLCLAGALGWVIGVLRLRAERRTLPGAGIRTDGEVCGTTTDPAAGRDDQLDAAEKSWGRRTGLPRQRTSEVAGEHPPGAGATPSEPRQ